MGFCPELARPLGALILIAWKAGRRGRVSEEVTAVRFSAAVTVLETKKEAFPSPPPFSVSSAEMFHWLLDHNCQLTPIAQFRKLNEKNLDVNMSVT